MGFLLSPLIFPGFSYFFLFRVRGLSLDTIKRRLDRGLYKRLDRFQEDVFACLERARRLSRTDSQVFEDSIELQAFFVRHRYIIISFLCVEPFFGFRDELCRNGEVLSSPALNYNLLHLSAAVEQQKQNKLLKESPEEEGDGKTSEVRYFRLWVFFSNL